MVRLFIDVGHNKRISPADIVGAIDNEGGIPGRAIGCIDIQDRSSFVDVPAELDEQVVRQMQHTRLRGMNANIRLADAKDSSSKGDYAGGGESSRDRVFKSKPKRAGKPADRKDRKKSTRDKPKKAKSK